VQASELARSAYDAAVTELRQKGQIDSVLGGVRTSTSTSSLYVDFDPLLNDVKLILMALRKNRELWTSEADVAKP
jgi:hypothetical protein